MYLFGTLAFNWNIGIYLIFGAWGLEFNFALFKPYFSVYPRVLTNPQQEGTIRLHTNTRKTKNTRILRFFIWLRARFHAPDSVSHGLGALSRSRQTSVILHGALGSVFVAFLFTTDLRISLRIYECLRIWAGLWMLLAQIWPKWIFSL